MLTIALVVGNAVALMALAVALAALRSSNEALRDLRECNRQARDQALQLRAYALRKGRPPVWLAPDHQSKDGALIRDGRRQGLF